MRTLQASHIVITSGIVSGLSCVLPLLTYAGDGQTSPPTTSPAVTVSSDLDPIAFERWVVKTSEETSTAKREPSAIMDMILKRLKDGIYVTDKAVMYGIGAWTGYEGRLAQRDSAKKGSSYDMTIAMIDKLSVLLYGRPWLKAQIQIRKAELYDVEGKHSEAIAVRQAANIELDSLYEEVSTHYIDNMTTLGQLFYSQGENKEAERVFLQVLSFPWYLTKSPTQQTLRNCYVQAGRGLIDCRRDNLRALQGTYFVPASLNELGPILDRAIVEAGGKPRRGSISALDADVQKPSSKPKP